MLKETEDLEDDLIEIRELFLQADSMLQQAIWSAYMSDPKRNKIVIDGMLRWWQKERNL